MIELWGVDLVGFVLRGLHAMMAAAWLLFDFLVYWLHFGVKDPARPLADRLERARIMHRIDQVVGVIFLVMLPSGISLCLVTDTALFSTAWLNWKHVLYAVIVIDALYLIPVSGAALRNLRKIEAGDPDVDRLNAEIAGSMNRAMPAVFLIWFLVALISLISVLNLRIPEGQEFIFRRTAIELPATTSNGTILSEATTSPVAVPPGRSRSARTR